MGLFDFVKRGRRPGRPKGSTQANDIKAISTKLIKKQARDDPEYAIVLAEKTLGIKIDRPDPVKVEAQRAAVELARDDPEFRRALAEAHLESAFGGGKRRNSRDSRDEDEFEDPDERFFRQMERMTRWDEFLQSRAEQRQRPDADSMTAVLAEAVKPGGAAAQLVSAILNPKTRVMPQVSPPMLQSGQMTVSTPQQPQAEFVPAQIQLNAGEPTEQTQALVTTEQADSMPPIDDPVSCCEYVWSRFMKLYQESNLFTRVGFIASINTLVNLDDSGVIEALAPYSSPEMQPMIERGRSDVQWSRRFVERLRELWGHFSQEIGIDQSQQNGHDVEDGEEQVATSRRRRKTS